MKINCNKFRANTFVRCSLIHPWTFNPWYLWDFTSIRIMMGGSLSEFLFRDLKYHFWRTREVSTSVSRTISDSHRLLVSVHLWLYPIEIPREIVTTPSTASHLDGMPIIDYITHIISCISCIKPQSRGGKSRRRSFDSRGATGDFVTRSYSWSILGLQVR